MAAAGRSPSRDPSPYRNTSSSHHVSNRSSAYFQTDSDQGVPTRSRANSNARYSSVNTSTPLHTAVNSAVRNADTSSQVDPNLVAHITEQVTKNVINAMKASGMTGSPSASETSETVHPSSFMNTGSDSRNSQSPANSTPTSLPPRYTPPSPIGIYDGPNDRSASPETFYSEPGTNSNDTPRPTWHRDRQRSPSRNDDTPITRPNLPRAATAIHETTVLENVWQPLFEGGIPTARLGQFLRGIAIHLVEEYQPKSTLIVTPAKMVQFFNDTRQPDEFYPFCDIFGGRCTNASISRLYQALKCQHHLVQIKDTGEPTIPGLTPYGFEIWMTTLIQAHPEKEYDRLAKAVLNMPISNADMPSERFPKELPRRLLPAEGDRITQQRLHNAVSADRNIQLRGSNPIPPPPPSQPPPQVNTTIERERNLYSSTTARASSYSNYNQDDSTSRIPIERERQPYTAREGTGKVYDDRDCSTDNRGSRSNSTTPAPPSAYNSGSSSTRPTDIAPSNHQRHHRSSMTGSTRPNLQTGSVPAVVSGTKNPYTKSEGANVGDIPREYYTSNLGLRNDRNSPEDDAIATAASASRRYRRATAEDENRYGTSSQSQQQPPSSRQQTSASSTYDYGREGRDGRDTRERIRDRDRDSSAYDDSRRRSTYQSGTDGYRSYSRDGSRY